MLQFIQHNIYNPEKLRVEYMADQFNVSATYIGEYFKNRTGQTLQNYILQYKMNMVEARLKFSDLTVSEIADELNFENENDLTLLFKEYKGVNPSEFRKVIVENVSSETALA